MKMCILVWGLLFTMVLNGSLTEPSLTLMAQKRPEIIFCFTKEMISSYCESYDFVNNFNYHTKILVNDEQPIGYSWYSGKKYSKPLNARLLKKWLQGFALTNKSLYEYFSQETVQISIISACLAHHIKDNEKSMAQSLGFRNIVKKIDYYYEKARPLQLSPQEWQQSWYLRSRRNENEPVVIYAMNTLHLDSIRIVVPHLFPEELGKCLVNAVQLLTKKNFSNQKVYEKINCILEKGINPDYRAHEKEPTSLALMIIHNRRKIAQLLLKHGACPSLEVEHEDQMKSIFDIAQKVNLNKWLNKIYKKIKKHTSVKMS